MEYSNWQVETDHEQVAWLGMDRKGASLNSLSSDVLSELAEIIAQLKDAKLVGLVIYSAKSTGFCAGADIKEFDTLTDPQDIKQRLSDVHTLFNDLGDLAFPTLAVIEGVCLGGGLELALACNYRIAVNKDSTRLGFPEINLGIIPAFGGSARSTRLLGGQKAMELMLTARNVRASRAKSLGLVDKLVSIHGSWKWQARAMLLKKPKQSTVSLVGRLSNSSLARPVLAKLMRKQVAKKANPQHYPAPYALIDLWEASGSNFIKMLEGERRVGPELLLSETSINLRRVFYLMERLKALGKQDDPWRPKRVHVVGAGVMGGDIAAWCALRGLDVTLQDRGLEFIEPAIKRAHSLFRKKLRSDSRFAAAKPRLTADPDGRGIANADVIIEAIYENLEAKQKLFSDLEKACLPDALLATNTSAIPLAEIATSLSNPSRLVGIHFFNPVAKMPLVEIVSDSDTDVNNVIRGQIFCGAIDRFPLPVRSAPGFLVNRVLAPYMAEALTVHREGISKEAIDAALIDFGMPMGPVELADTVGLDVCLSVLQKLAPDDKSSIEELQEMVEAGNLGKKSGQGLYSWDKGKPVKAELEQKADGGLAKRILEPLFEQCKACIAENIVEDEDLVDAGVIFGTGFAPFRGGPLHYLESNSVAKEG